MNFRKLILFVLPSCLFILPLSAQVNSRNPANSPDFQTTADDEEQNSSSKKQTPSTPSAPVPAPVATAVATPAPAPTEDLTADQIIQNAIRRDEELRDLREGFSYQLKLITQQLDEDEKVIPDKTKTVTAKIKPSKDITFSADFNDDSKPASGDAKPSGNKTTYAGAASGRGLRSTGKSSGSDDDSGSSNKDVEDARKVNAMLDMGKIAPRFNYTKTGNEMIRDRACYVIKFTPKKDQPFASREEKVINKVGGTIWIDQKDFSIIRTKGSLTEEVEVAWFLASMKGLDFDYQTSELAAIQIPVPSDFAMDFVLNIMGYRMEQKQTSTMNDYQIIPGKLPPTDSTTPPPASAN